MVTLHVKTTAGKKFSIEIELEATVAAAKTALVGPTEVPEAQQRLIYKGKVLKDELTLASYGAFGCGVGSVCGYGGGVQASDVRCCVLVC